MTDSNVQKMHTLPEIDTSAEAVGDMCDCITHGLHADDEVIGLIQELECERDAAAKRADELQAELDRLRGGDA